MEFGKVIKVKFGDTLRRFSVPLDLNGGLDLDMAGLRAKILSLFNFPPDADLTLTYVDEDGDVVTLVDDEDMRDMMRQNLKFLRIDIKLSNDKGGKPYSTSSSGSSTPLRSGQVQGPFPIINASSGSSTPLKSGQVQASFPIIEAGLLKSTLQPRREQVSPPVQHSFPNGNAGVVEVKSAPQPLLEPLKKLARDVASKAASGPVPAELVDFFMKMGESYMNADYRTHAGADSSSTQDVAGGSNATKDGGIAEVIPKSISVDSASKNSYDVNTGNVTTIGVEAPVIPLPSSVDLNLPPTDSNPSGVKVLKFAPPVSKVPPENFYKLLGKYRNGLKSSDCDEPASSSAQIRPISTANMSVNPFNQCPFAGTAIANDSAMPHTDHPFKRSHSHSASMGGMFHTGIQCDGCGVHPIIGPRYKSKVKENFDLCGICFSETGNETDYIKMERPVTFRHARSFKGLHDQMNATWVGAPVLPHNVYKVCGAKLGRPKLNSRFIVDVNVVDGTMMAPCTPFTKIWRMRNNGSLIWPQGTQLVWIGGDKYSDAVSVELEVPADGLPVDQELEIAVDFTAPESPGRYISYWRMASPSGQKFGQRVWVLIQVDDSFKDSVCDSLEGLNLNLPPVNSVSKGPEISVYVQPASTDGDLLQPSNPNIATEPTKPVVEEPTKRDHDLNFPINDALLVGNGISSSAPPQPVSYPIVDLSVVPPVIPIPEPSNAPAAPALVQSKVVDVPTLSAERVGVNNAVEATLLQELQEMGFKQVDLNKEILRMNGYNLEQSLDHLCGVSEWDPILDVDHLYGVSEWDPILEELQEMGFRDNETNKRLLVKNNGSIKLVVMDLINGEKKLS